MCDSKELESEPFRNSRLCGCLSTFTSYKKRRWRETGRLACLKFSLHLHFVLPEPHMCRNRQEKRVEARTMCSTRNSRFDAEILTDWWLPTNKPENSWQELLNVIWGINLFQALGGVSRLESNVWFTQEMGLMRLQAVLQARPKTQGSFGERWNEQTSFQGKEEVRPEKVAVRGGKVKRGATGRVWGRREEFKGAELKKKRKKKTGGVASASDWTAAKWTA